VLDAAATKASGAARAHRQLEHPAQPRPWHDRHGWEQVVPLGGYAGDWLAAALSSYLHRTGSVIVALTLLFLAVILSTQFSFGRFFASIAGTLQTRCPTFSVLQGKARGASPRQEPAT